MLEESRKKIILNSILIGYIIVIPLLNHLYGLIGIRGPMLINCCIVAVGLMLTMLNRQALILNRYWFGLFAVVTIYYVGTLGISHTSLSVVEFFFYVIVAAIAGKSVFNYEIVLKTVTYTSLLMVPLWRNLFEESVSHLYTNSSVSLALSYAVLPVIVAGFIHFVYYRNSANIILKICYILDLLIVGQLILKANRGLIVCLVVTVFCVYIKGKDSSNTKKRAIRTGIILIASMFLIINLSSVLNIVSHLFDYLGLSANFIQKMARLSADITNGRSTINEYVFSSFSQHPIIGHGISSIFYNTNGEIVYPHNFLLQLLYDGGVILFVLFLAPLYKTVKSIYRNENKDESLFLLFIFLCTVPKMLFSTDMWTNASFFVMVSYILARPKSGYYLKNNV